MEPVSQGAGRTQPASNFDLPKGPKEGAAAPVQGWEKRSWKAQALAVPNLLTYLRLVAVPVFIWAFVTRRSELALGLFIGAAVTDSLDGLLARALRMQTRLGTYLDPIADKCLTFSALVLLVARTQLPAWLLGLVLFRDVGIVIAAADLRHRGVHVPSVPTRFGKYATFTLVATITLALARSVSRTSALDGYVAAAALLALQCVSIAIVQYFLRWRRLMRAQ